MFAVVVDTVVADILAVDTIVDIVHSAAVRIATDLAVDIVDLAFAADMAAAM